MSFEMFQAVDRFRAGLQDMVTAYSRRHHPVLEPDKIELDIGRRYVRVVRAGSQRMCHCFIDTRNGDVLKANGWRGPERKHPRGNVLDAHNGLSRVNVYGADYLDGTGTAYKP